MEKVCKVLYTELYGNTPISTVLNVGNEVYFLLTPNLEKSKLNFVKGKVLKALEYGVNVERKTGNIVSKFFVGRNTLFLEKTVTI
jgi:hypothetical protein